MGLPAKEMASKGHTNGTPSSSAARYNLPSHFIGGNHLDAAPPSKVKEFVQAHDGHTVITNVSRVQQLLTRSIMTDLVSLGSHRKQRYCGREGNPKCAEMGIRDIRQ
jgi:hypothetical protein